MSNMVNVDGPYTPRQAADILEIPYNTFRRYRDKGRIRPDAKVETPLTHGGRDVVPAYTKENLARFAAKLYKLED